MAAQLNFEVSNQTVKRTDDFNVVQLSKITCGRTLIS